MGDLQQYVLQYVLNLWATGLENTQLSFEVSFLANHIARIELFRELGLE